MNYNDQRLLLVDEIASVAKKGNTKLLDRLIKKLNRLDSDNAEGKQTKPTEKKDKNDIGERKKILLKKIEYFSKNNQMEKYEEAMKEFQRLQLISSRPFQTLKRP